MKKEAMNMKRGIWKGLEGGKEKWHNYIILSKIKQKLHGWYHYHLGLCPTKGQRQLSCLTHVQEQNAKEYMVVAYNCNSSLWLSDKNYTREQHLEHKH